MPWAGKGHALRKARILEQRLWAEIGSKMNAPSLSDQRILLVGFPPAQRARLREMLDEIGVRMFATTGCPRKLALMCDTAKVFGIILVDFDSFADTEDGVDALLAFRSKSQRVPVILCSAGFKGDDLSTERSAICEASLRFPTTRERLRVAMLAAIENHSTTQTAR
jgi:DNA-binding NtrC family response regulator